MASGIARGRVRTTTTTTVVESRKMAVVLQIIGWQGHGALVYGVLLWHWTFMSWSIDTCQNKVSADQYHVTISRAQGLCFFEVDRWPSAAVSIGSRAHVRLTCWKQDRILRKQVNASPGLKYIWIITDKTQIKILPFPSWVRLIRHWTAWPRSYAIRLA